MASPPQTFQVVLDADGPRVIVNGQPLPGVVGVRVDGAPGEFPTMILEMRASAAEILGHDADVYVQESRDQIREFLDTLDWRELENEALNRAGFKDHVSEILVSLIKERSGAYQP